MVSADDETVYVSFFESTALNVELFLEARPPLLEDDFLESGLRRQPIPRSGLCSGRRVVSSAPSLEVFCRK